MEIRNKMQEIADEVDGTVRDDYSGRGMYGEECFGVVCEDADECLELAGSKGITGGRVDNMGKRMIVYWPKLKPDNKDDDMEDDEEEY